MSAAQRPGSTAHEDDVDVDTLVEQQAPAAYGQPTYGAGVAAQQPIAPPPAPIAPPPKSGRTRPTNNQLLYKAYFRWSHYQFKLQPGLVLPDETEACASVTSAFLQVLNTLFFVETRRIENPRNILQLLSMNTRRTKVVELSSGTHRVPDELRRHSLSDGGTGSYSTNLDRNRYGNDDQYLSTVIRYDLEFLDLCPCMVDVEIIDAKNGQGSILVSADPEMCNCGSAGSGGVPAAGLGGGPGSGRNVQHTGGVLPRGVGASPAAPRSASKAASAGDGQAPGASAGTGAGAVVAAAGGERPTASKNSGSELFDALLIAATGNTTAEDPAGATSKQAAPGGIPRARSRLWHTAASTGEVDSLHNAVEAFKAGEGEEIASGQAPWEGGRGSPPVPLPGLGARGKRIPRRSSLSNVALLSSPEDNASLPPVAPLSAGRPLQGLTVGGPGEESGENGLRTAAGNTAEASAEETAQAEAAGEADATKQAAGGAVARPVPRAGSAANLARLGRDQELRRLQDDFRGLKEDARALEGQLTGIRQREQAATNAAVVAREDADTQRQTVSALRAEVARLIAAKEAAETEAARVRTAVQAHGGSVATPPPSADAPAPAPPSPTYPGSTAASRPEAPPAEVPELVSLPPIKRKLEEAAATAEEPSAKRPSEDMATQAAPVTPAAPEVVPAPAAL